MASKLFENSLSTEEKKQSYTSKIFDNKERYADPRNFSNFILTQDSAFRRSIHVASLKPDAIKDFNTDYSFMIKSTGKTNQFILKYVSMTFTIPGATFGGGGPDVLTALSAAPFERLDIYYHPDLVTTITKHQVAEFMTSQSLGVQEVMFKYWTQKDDISVNASKTTIWLPIPLSEAIDLANIEENTLEFILRTCTQANYGTSGAGTVQLDDGLGLALSCECNLHGIYFKKTPEVPKGLAIPQSYFTQTLQYLDSFTTPALTTTHSFEYNSTLGNTVANFKFYITDQALTGPDWMATLENCFENVKIENSSGDAVYDVSGSTNLQENNEMFEELTEQKLRTRKRGGYLADFSNITPIEYEEDNHVPQNLFYTKDRKYKINFANLTAGTTYYVYTMQMQLAKIITHYSQTGSISKLEVAKVSVQIK